MKKNRQTFNAYDSQRNNLLQIKSHRSTWRDLTSATPTAIGGGKNR